MTDYKVNIKCNLKVSRPSPEVRPRLLKVMVGVINYACKL